MSKIRFIKVVFLATFLILGFIGFSFPTRSEMQKLDSSQVSAKMVEELNFVKDYKNWTKVSKNNSRMDSVTAVACAAIIREIPIKGSDIEKSPHHNKYINVYINAIGKSEMLTKKKPKFPVGTVIVKEKLDSPNSQTPELLTVMVKRKKGFNPKIGDWEFMTLDGEAKTITSRGKLESCQACHLEYKRNDYVTRIYLSDEIKQKLK